MNKINTIFITMFKEPVESFLKSSIIARAINNNIIQADIFSILDFVDNKHHKIDDTPFGGGPGELIKIDIIEPMIKKALEKNIDIERKKKRVILLDPSGVTFNQNEAKRLANFEELIFVCGRYEGIDARVYHYVDEAISLGDFVLSNGDLAALAIFDATMRLIPGVLGNTDSIINESHYAGLLEASHYTRPKIYENYSVPKVYMNGNHKAIIEARTKESLSKTKILRPDLLNKYSLSKEEKKLLEQPYSIDEYFPWLTKYE